MAVKGGKKMTPVFADGTPNGFAYTGGKKGGNHITLVDDNGNLLSLGGSTPPIIVTELPTTGTVGITYLVPSANPTPGNEYDEYIWTSAGAWELIGGSSGGGGGATTATQVSFDNTNSSLEANNVQVALEELDDELQLARTMEVYTAENVSLEQVATEFPEYTFQNLDVKIDANDYYFGYVAPNSIILTLSGQFNFGIFSKAVFNRPIAQGEFVSMMVYLMNKATDQPIAQLSGYLESGSAERRFDFAGLSFNSTANTECYVKISLQASNPISVDLSEIEFIASLSGIPNFTNTQAIQLTNQTNESLSGTAVSQYDINVENKNAIVALQNGGGSGSATAETVSYVNTTSGLSATNVQQAIDELDTNMKTNYVTNETLDNKLHNIPIEDIVGVSYVKEKSSIMIYDKNIDAVTNGFELVSEASAFDLIEMVKATDQNIIPSNGTQTITWSSANVTGTMFSRQTNAIKVNVDTVGAKFNAAIKYSLIGVTTAFKATVLWEVLKNGVVMPAYTKTEVHSASDTDLLISTGDVYGDVLANDLFQIRATITSTNPSATLKILTTSQFIGYKASSEANKIPFKAIQSVVVLGNSNTIATTLTTTFTSIASVTMPETLFLRSGSFNMRLGVDRTGGGQNQVGQLQLRFASNGTVIETTTHVIRFDDITDIPLTNINSRTLTNGANITISAAYFGSGTLATTSLKYEMNGEPV